jgi:hypothetical protein
MVTTRLRTAGFAGALVAVLAVLATGCGDGGRLSAREYVREASRICSRANHRTERAEHMAQKAAAQAAAAADLAGLKPPDSLSRFDAVWVALVRQSAAELEALVDSMSAGDHEQAAQQREAVGILTARAAKLARAHGITACPAHFGPAQSSV